MSTVSDLSYPVINCFSPTHPPVEIYIYISLTCLAHVWSRNSLYLFFHSSPALVFFLDPMQTPNPPPYDSEKSSNGQKITMNPDGYSNKASSLRIFGGGGEGRRMEAGLRWPDIALSDQTGSPLAVRVRILGSTSDQQQSHHFAQRRRRHLWEDSGIKNMHKIFNNMQKNTE